MQKHDLARWSIDVRIRAGFGFTCVAFALLLNAGNASLAADANFERCFVNDRSCNAVRLTAEERQRIFEQHRRMHFEDCLAGLRCNQRSLTGDELRRVQDATVVRNLRLCLKGDSSCEKSILTDAQRANVGLADSARNFEFCLGGLTACDGAALSDAQRAAVRAAYLERNYRGCMNAVGTLVKCELDDLSDAQREMVRRRTLEANIVVCTNGFFGCDERLLTSEQRARIGASSSRQP